MRLHSCKSRTPESAKTKMEMRAREDIAIGQDITPPLPPLAFSLFDSSLSSHCSSCFRRLSAPPTSTTSSTFLRHCSNTACSSTTTTSLHFSSAEHHLFTLLHSNPSLYPHPDSSDLRLSLRLLHLLPSHSPSPRLLGLLTNRHQLISDEVNSTRVRVGARAMAMARAMRDERELKFELDSDSVDCELEEEEAVLCLVITNAVEINLNGERLGIGVYDKCFSWINHSCSPNSCYRFVTADSVSESSDSSPSFRLFPCGDAAQIEDRGDCTTRELAKGVDNYGPRINVRSIKGIQRGEEVTITYTDLLQPTAQRQSELLLEYGFFCNCKRCSAVPQNYVDHALQETFCVHHHTGCSQTVDKRIKEKLVETLRDLLDSIVTEYMEVGDPVSCCEKVEGLLSEGLSNQHLEQAKSASDIDIKLSPIHFLSLSAYTTLISTYKIRADLSGETHLQSIDMNRTSAAYSLLFAGATHHLFLSEPSLIASAATFWIDAGQSLLSFGRRPWNCFANGELRNLSAVPDVKCPRCSLMGKFESHFSSNQIQNNVFDDITQEFHKCTSIITPKGWSFLIQGCKSFKDVKDPIDLSWIKDVRTSGNTRSQHAEFNLCHGSENGDLSECVSGNESIDVRTAIIRLGAHCLFYGGYLYSICNGYSCSTRLIRSVIHI